MTEITINPEVDTEILYCEKGCFTVRLPESTDNLIKRCPFCEKKLISAVYFKPITVRLE